ncbi:hypothetical protein QFZ21_004148 [Microbacterium sp. W4I20]|nr:hypothetical protein [Microbacterium sp. W4I20]
MVARLQTRPQAMTLVDASGVSPFTHDEAWALAARLSPRTQIRVAGRDASGTVLNEYDRLWPLNEPAPTTTWAMLLADDSLRYRWLAFDFDASSGNAKKDASTMAHWLAELNVPHLVCISGPSGGRHIWVHLDSPTDASVIRLVADLARSLLPSLDITPLANPSSGCLRPPGAPHRAGGQSTPVGDLRYITEHSASEEFLDELIALLYDLGAEVPVREIAPAKGMITGADGHPKIRGQKRPLSMHAHGALHGSPGADASHTLFVALTGCARARWALSDVREHLEVAGGLEYVRTRRVGQVPSGAAGVEAGSGAHEAVDARSSLGRREPDTAHRGRLRVSLAARPRHRQRPTGPGGRRRPPRPLDDPEPARRRLTRTAGSPRCDQSLHAAVGQACRRSRRAAPCARHRLRPHHGSCRSPRSRRGRPVDPESWCRGGSERPAIPACGAVFHRGIWIRPDTSVYAP